MFLKIWTPCPYPSASSKRHIKFVSFRVGYLCITTASDQNFIHLLPELIRGHRRFRHDFTTFVFVTVRAFLSPTRQSSVSLIFSSISPGDIS